MNRNHVPVEFLWTFLTPFLTPFLRSFQVQKQQERLRAPLLRDSETVSR